MSIKESSFSVDLCGTPVGLLRVRGDHTTFTFNEEYIDRIDRPVLGLHFENRLTERHSAHLRLPPWFSNLLPEGVLRKWVADERGVSEHREMELLAQVGHDLPGGVRVRPADAAPTDDAWEPTVQATGSTHIGDTPIRFSLAGVNLKFSMVKLHDRLTLPASGEGGDWIVKLPDTVFPMVPHNEFAMMRLAKAVGIDIPEITLIHRDSLESSVAHLFPQSEEWAYAIKRFDRGPDHGLIHMEDLAQVLGIYPEQKYNSKFESVASLIHRKRYTEQLREFARRLAFNFVIGNGDAHLKNWSLIYRDARIPELSPAYDIVSVAPYETQLGGIDTGLKFNKTKRFDKISLVGFRLLETRVGARNAHLADEVIAVIDKVNDHWPTFRDELALSAPDLAATISETIIRHGSLLRRFPTA